MADLVDLLKPKERRGSKARCHFLTHGSTNEVAVRLTRVAPRFARVSVDDRWMPRGFSDREEAQLHKAERLLGPSVCKQLREWWFAKANPQSKSPNFDIASTCTIEDKRGVLLIEAKAHDQELINETAGKRLKVASSEGTLSNHRRIGMVIDAACRGLESATSLEFHISRDTHYQMSNRFAWSWKLTALGFPVVLVYLGFLNASEMRDKGSSPFPDRSVWKRVVKTHSDPLFPFEVWGRRWTCNGQAFVPLIRSFNQPLPA